MTLSLQAEQNSRLGQFSPDTVEKILRYGAVVGSEINHFDSTQRLMDLARQRIAECEKQDRSFHSGSIFIASELTGSKGRFKRSWHAPQGGIWMALVIADTLLPESAALYSLAAGVACCETVRQFQVMAHVKWVNDVVYHGAKLAGVLTETYRGKLHGENYIIIGIGLNVNNSLPKELESLADSMAGICGHDFPLEAVTEQLLAKLAWNIGLLYYVEEERPAFSSQENQNDHLLIESWKKLSNTIGRRVRYGYNVVENPLYKAKVMGIDNLGQLQMKLEDGVMVTENSGEIMYID